MPYIDIVIELVPGVGRFLDQDKWDRFMEMRERGVPLTVVGRELNIPERYLETLESVRRCILKWNGDKDQVRRCLRGDIDP